jgi:hypothetical protein
MAEPQSFLSIKVFADSRSGGAEPSDTSAANAALKQISKLQKKARKVFIRVAPGA